MAYRSDHDVDIKGNELSSFTLGLVVCGSVGLVESVKFVRELRRYGASIQVWMTPSAANLLSPKLLEWASKKNVITELSGSAEHISSYDAVIVAPATLNTIAKISMGFADNAALTMIHSMIERRPLFIAPAMHDSLRDSFSFKEHWASLLKRKNIFALEPMEEEGKSKLSDFESMTATICHTLNNKKEKRALVLTGPTRSYADDVRFLSNISTGELGLKIADKLFRNGFDVEVLAGPIQTKIPSYLKSKNFETTEELRDLLIKENKSFKPTHIIYAAAILDFEVADIRKGKTTSKDNEWSLKLRPTQKIIDEVLEGSPIKIGFKLESDLSEIELKDRVASWAEKKSVEWVIANRLEDLKPSHKAYLFDQKANAFTAIEGKNKIAETLVSLIH